MSKHPVAPHPQKSTSAQVLQAVSRPLTQITASVLFSAMLLAISTSSQAVTDTLTASGTWTAPPGVTSVDVEVWGGGGGGGGGDGTQSDGGGGGGGGAYSKTTAITVVPGTTYTVTVGAAGAAGATGSNGGAGGDSWFINTTTILAKGGAGGATPLVGAGGVAGAGGSAAAGVGATKFSGGNGGTGRNSNSGRGGPGGSSAGTAANGANGPDPWSTCTAASAPTGGGIGGDGGCSNNQNGFAPASGNGGGGGGAAERNTSGGAGASGKVAITYTNSTPLAATYYHDTTAGVNIGVDGPTNVSPGTYVTIPPIITASLITANTCTSDARSRNHPTGLYTHSRWYLTSNYAVATNIAANPSGSANLRGGSSSDTVTVSLYNYDPVSGGKTLIGSSTPFSIATATAVYAYTINSASYVVPAGHRLMLQYDFNQTSSTYRARVHCPSSITVTVSAAAAAAPIAEYRMDEAGWSGTANEVADNSGNALHGTALLGASTAPAKLCNGGNFAANYAEVADNALLDLPSALTVTAWLKPARWGGTPGKDALMSFLSKDTNYEAHITSAGKVNWWWGTGNITSATSAPIGAWTHVAMVYTSGSQTLYINGVADATGTVTGALPVNALPFQIGDDQGYGGGTRRYDGMIDEIKIFGSALPPSQIATGYANENAGKNWDGSARTCPSLLDHVSIDAPVTAMAFSTSPVAISPHTAAHAALSGHTINLSTSTGQGDWSIGTGTGTLTPGAANSGLASYTFGTGESAASLYFTYQSADTVSIYVTDAGGTDLLSNTPIAELSNTITYTLPDFVFTDSTCVHNIAFGAAGQTCAVLSWSPQVAGIDVANVYITALNGGIPSRLHPVQVRTRDMAFALSCHNPVTSAGVQAAFSGVTLPLCQANGAAPATWSTSTLTASFPGGTPTAGPYSFNYADVGKVELWMRDSAATTQVGASGQFVVAPHHFGISGVTAGPIKAGSGFSATVTVYNGKATPTATPNFGKENLHLAPPADVPEGVTITFTKCQPTGASSSAGTFSSGTIPAFASGATTAGTLNWGEVGNGDLTATLSGGSYLLSGLTASGNTSASGTVCDDGTGAAVAGRVGNFVPHHFNTYVIAPMTTCPAGQSCPVAGWAYSGQSFSVNVSAANASDAITLNYDGTTDTSPNFAQAATLEAWDAAGSTTTQDPPAAAAGILSNTAIPAASFNQGSTILGTPATPSYTFATSPTTPTDIYLRAADADASSLRSLAATSIEGGVKIVSGRVKINNNYGSELLPLTMRATVQFYGGMNWLTSNADSATSFDSALSTSGGNVVVSNMVDLGGAVSIAAPSTAAVTSGVRTFTVNAPGVPGSADFQLNAPAYLLAGSNRAAVDPSIPGRATFGIYSGDDAFIYQREAY